METDIDKFRILLTPEFEREVLAKLTFLKAFCFEDDASVKNLQEEYPDWCLSYTKEKLKVSVSISAYAATVIISYEQKYFLFNHYLRFTKDDELSKLRADYFPHRFNMDAKRQYFLDTLDLFAKHAQLGLKPVLEGKVWIDVPNYNNEYR